jgi:hypothetical protein
MVFRWWRTSSSSSGDRLLTCPTASARGSDTRSSPLIRLPLLHRLVGGRHHLQPRGSPEPHPQPGPVPAGRRPGHRQRAVLQGADGRRQQPQHPLCAHLAPTGDRVGPTAAQYDAIPWRRVGQARPAPRADQPAGLVRHTSQLPQGNTHLRGGGVQGRIPRHPWAVVLRQVHGGPELHLPQDEDAGAKRCHYRGFFN